MTLLDTVNIGGSDYGLNSKVPMGTCATPAGSEVKECAFADNFALSAGNLIAVTFTYANTYGDGSTTYPKLTVNGVQHPVKFPTGEYASSGAWANGQAVTFMFDGTNLLMTTLPIANEVALNNMHSVTSNAVYKKGNDIETFELTASDFASSITDLIIRFAKGFYNPLTHIVSLSIDIYSASNLIPVINDTICIIPTAKYRPRNRAEGYAVVYDSSSVVKWEACFIESNGKIALGNFIYGNHPTKAVAFEISYFAN